MDFVVCISKTLSKFDYVCVIVDRLGKFVHLVSVQVTYNADKFGHYIH